MRSRNAILVLTLATVAACDTAQPRAAVATPAPAATAATLRGDDPENRQHELGRAVYNFRCYFCHGYSGDARTLAATFLAPAPRDFTAAAARLLDAAAVRQAVRNGRPGTAMRPFRTVLSQREINAVSNFVVREFIRRKSPNTRYHTAQNGWPEHQRYASAFAFATGQLPIDAPEDSLDAEQQRGRQLFLSTCVSCHDRARVSDAGPAWSARPVSYPRAGFVPGAAARPIDVISGASVYASHDVPPHLDGLTPEQARGERLFQANCAFCHGADGTGKNWIGQFMEPKARDLTAYTKDTLPSAHLRSVVRDGLEGTSMPAWKQVLTPEEIDAVAAYVTRAFLGARHSGATQH